jgi:hypothetical protein
MSEAERRFRADHPTFAFPHQDVDYHDGMTLRDYFAAKAMVALLTTDHWSPDARVPEDIIPEVCKEAYFFADEMMKARLR